MFGPVCSSTVSRVSSRGAPGMWSSRLLGYRLAAQGWGRGCGQRTHTCTFTKQTLSLHMALARYGTPLSVN